MTSPAMRLAHLGIAVKNLETMVSFYTNVLGFAVSDRGITRGTPIAFLTRSPREHHQLVLQEQRKSDETTINQISFQMHDLDGLRRMRDILIAVGVEELKLVNHCIAWSIYCHDPEGNRLEFFVDSPFYVNQPMTEVLDLEQADEAVIESTRLFFSNDSSFCHFADWSDEFAQAQQFDGG